MSKFEMSAEMIAEKKVETLVFLLKENLGDFIERVAEDKPDLFRDFGTFESFEIDSYQIAELFEHEYLLVQTDDINNSVLEMFEEFQVNIEVEINLDDALERPNFRNGINRLYALVFKYPKFLS